MVEAHGGVSPATRRILIALALSLALHLALLLAKLPTPPEPLFSSHKPSPLNVTLAPPVQAPSPPTPSRQPTPPRRAVAAAKRPPRVRLMTRIAPEKEKAWTQVEKDDMNRFLNELNTEAKPPSSAQLAQRSLAMARTLGREAQKNDEIAVIDRRLEAANVEPLDLELYFDALFKKLNRSAAMVRDTAHDPATKLGIVRIALNPDGTVKSFTIVQSADQQAEIAYVKSVVERAAPFAAFPPQIRKATNALILQICIQPTRLGGGDGAQFTRMAPGQGCRDNG